MSEFRDHLKESFHIMQKSWGNFVSNKINTYLKLFPHIKMTVYLQLKSDLEFFLYSIYILISHGVLDIIMAPC